MAITVGCDIGQSVDCSGIVVVSSYVPEPTHVDDRPEMRHRVRWVEKIPLGTGYPAVVERIVTVAEAAAYHGPPVIVLDATGVGRPILDMLRQRTSISIRAVTYTGAAKESQTDAYSYRVPKRDLMATLELVLERDLIETVPDLPLAEDLEAEIRNFKWTTSDRGHTTYEGHHGTHDDLVNALCLALWGATRRGSADAMIGAVRRLTERALGRVAGMPPLTRELA